MGYTKTIKGKSQLVNITDTPQSLADLLGANVPDPDIANRVKIYFIGALIGANAVAWYTEDPDTVVAPSNGRPLYSGGIITITKQNFDDFRIVKNSGADFDMFCVQFDHEQETT